MRWMLAVAAVGTLAGCPADDVPPDDVLDGPWRLTWTCTDGCGGHTPAIAGAADLEVAGGELTWNTSPASTITGERDDACVSAPDGTRLPHPTDVGWSLYDFVACADGGVLSAEVYAISSSGEQQVRWMMTGARP